jgi:hypothetical protein
VNGQLHDQAPLPWGKSPRTNWIGGWVCPRTSLGYVERRKILPLLGLKPRYLGRPACSQSLYRLLCAFIITISQSVALREWGSSAVYSTRDISQFCGACTSGAMLCNVKRGRKEVDRNDYKWDNWLGLERNARKRRKEVTGNKGLKGRTKDMRY